MQKKFSLIALGLLTAAFLLGCAAQEIPVTRLVEVQVPVTVEVTAPPVLTPIVQTAVVEVTRLVETGGERFDGRLIVGIPEYPNSLDLPQANSPTARMVAWHLYDSLVQTDAQSNILPALAESWVISEDNLTYTFTLRRGVSFHNGEQFTADAVRFSWERGSTPANANSAAWQAVSEVVVVDDYTVRLVTAEPNVNLLRLIADQWAMVPPSYIAEVGENSFVERPIGTGPFQFVESEQNGYITLEANSTYWNPSQPQLRYLSFRWVINPAERFDLLRNGRIHVVSGLEAAEAVPLLSAPDVRLVSYPQDRIYFIGFSRATAGDDSPLEDARVRLAMNHAINRPEMVTTLFDGLAHLSTSLVTPSNLGYDPTLLPLEYDPVLARSLLEAAGFGDGFTVEMACPAEAYPLFNEVCLWVQADLAEVGITAELTFLPPTEFFETPPRDLPALFGDRRTGDGTEAYSRLNGLLGGSDYATWYDEDIGRLIRQLRQTAEPSTRADLYAALQAELQADPPFIYLYEPLRFEAVNAAVQNYTPRASEIHFFSDVYLTP